MSTSARRHKPHPGEIYTVQEDGETLFMVAERAYGDGNKWTGILVKNPRAVPERLLKGEQLYIPTEEELLSIVPSAAQAF